MDRKTSIIVAASMTLVMLLAAAMFFFGEPERPRGTTFGEPYPEAADFTLVRSNGDVFQLSQYRGDVVLLYFGYTMCPDVCPITLAQLNLALEKLKPEDAARVKVVFVTVDPDRDTPEIAQEYVERFNPNFIGLSGTEDELAQAWQGYGVFREIVASDSAAGYAVDHTARIMAVDRDGKLRVSFPFDASANDIVHDLKLLLKK